VNHRRLGAGVFALSLWILSGQLAVAANITSNGDFETGNTTGWTLGNGGPFDAVCANGAGIGASTCIAESGNFAMSFGLYGGVATLSQTLNTVAGHTYTLSFWLANDNPSLQNTETFSVAWDGNNVFSLPSPQPSFGYTQEVVLNLTATGSSTVLQFAAQHDPAQWFLDNVSVESTPEPATGALGGVALVALSLAGRWNKARGRQ
jgi:hypothetical protein